MVADLRDNGIDQKPPAIVYWPLLGKESMAQDLDRSAVCVLPDAARGSAALLSELQQAVAGVNPSVPVADVKTLQ